MVTGLVRADDQFRQVRATAFGLGLGERLDRAGVVAAEVGEHVPIPASASASRNAVLVL
jgi:hypothetical protein